MALLLHHQSLSIWKHLSSLASPLPSVTRNVLSNNHHRPLMRIFLSRPFCSLLTKQPIVGRLVISGFPNFAHTSLRFYTIRPGDRERKSGPVRFSKTKIGFFLFAIVMAVYGAYRGYLDFLDSLVNFPIDFDQWAPVPFPSSDDELRGMEFHRVQLRGKWDHANEVHIGPRKAMHTNLQWALVFSTDGFFVYTPFVLSGSGRRILVNRGWVSDRRKDPQKRPLGQVEGEVELNAYVLLKEHMQIIQQTRSRVNFDRFAFKDYYPMVDLEMLSRKINIDPVAIFVADKDSTVRGGPAGGQMDIPHEEMRYVVPLLYAGAALCIMIKIFS